MLSKNKTFIALTVKLLFCLSSAQAQNTADSAKQKVVVVQQAQPVFYMIKQPVTPLQVPGSFYAKQLPFFCSKELQVQKKIGFPVKFRLGSVEYCDRLEGKNK